MGSLYVNDFPNAGRMQQVIVQADAPARMQIDDVLRLNVRNASGGMVPLAEFATPVWSETPLQLVRYQGFLASRISGTPAPGDRKSTRLNSSHLVISYAVFCLKKKKREPLIPSSCSREMVAVLQSRSVWGIETARDDFIACTSVSR